MDQSDYLLSISGFHAKRFANSFELSLLHLVDISALEERGGWERGIHGGERGMKMKDGFKINEWWNGGNMRGKMGLIAHYEECIYYALKEFESLGFLT